MHGIERGIQRARVTVGAIGRAVVLACQAIINGPLSLFLSLFVFRKYAPSLKLRTLGHHLEGVLSLLPINQLHVNCLGFFGHISQGELILRLNTKYPLLENVRSSYGPQRFFIVLSLYFQGFFPILL